MVSIFIAVSLKGLYYEILPSGSLLQKNPSRPRRLEYDFEFVQIYEFKAYFLVWLPLEN